MLVLVPSETDRSRDVESLGQPDSKEMLLARIATGNEAAFGELYDEIAPRVLGLARRLLIDHTQSEEVTQEIFLEIWQNAPRYEPSKGGATTWIFTMAHRRAVDRIRSSQAGRDRDVRIGIRDYESAYDNVAETVETTIENERVKRQCRNSQNLSARPSPSPITAATATARWQKDLRYHSAVKTRLRDGRLGPRWPRCPTRPFGSPSRPNRSLHRRSSRPD